MRLGTKNSPRQCFSSQRRTAMTNASSAEPRRNPLPAKGCMQGVSPDGDDSNVLLRHHPLQLRVVTLTPKHGRERFLLGGNRLVTPMRGSRHGETVPTRLEAH